MKMTTYKITSETGKTYRRIAQSAVDAIGSICNYYGWRYGRVQFDADTSGKEWAQALIARDGTCNYNDRLLAEKIR